MPFKTKEEKREYDRKRNERIKEQIKERNKKYYEDNKENINSKKREYMKTYYLINKEQFKKNDKKYSEQNKHKLMTYKKEYNVKNKDKKNNYIKTRKSNDPLFKLSINIRITIQSSIKRKKFSKNSKTFNILGCTFDELKTHIESQFEPWMTWDNWGNPKDGIFEKNKTWDIGHIIPLSSATTEEEILQLNHHTNLKPLCSYVNRWVKRNNL